PFRGKPRVAVKELAERFDAIASDPRVKGVVLHLRPTPIPMARLQDLRELVGRLRKAGKRVVAWSTDYSASSYYLALACDEILLMPVGGVRPLGYATTATFLADALAKVGLQGE